VALDAYVAKAYWNLDPGRLPYLEMAANRGLGTTDYDKLPATWEKLMKRIATIKATNDKAAAEALITIAADPKHLGARIGLTAVLHTWGSALTQNPHS
jgi:hypothetical protein